MTSSVKISAHCSASKEVVVVVTGAYNGDYTKLLNDGETIDIAIYDWIQVSSYEREKVKE